MFKEWPVGKVIRELGVSATRVYLAKHRVSALLKREIKALERKINREPLRTAQPAPVRTATPV